MSTQAAFFSVRQCAKSSVAYLCGVMVTITAHHFALAQPGRSTPNDGLTRNERADASKSELLQKVERLEEQVSGLVNSGKLLNTDNKELRGELQRSQEKFQSELENARAESQEISKEIADSKRKSEEFLGELHKLNATIADLHRRWDDLNAAQRSAEMRIKKLEQANEAGSGVVSDLRAKVHFFRTFSTVATIAAAGLLFGIILLRPSKRAPIQRLQREIDLKSRPDAFRQLGWSVERNWSRLRPGQPWQENWVVLMRDALALIIEPGTPESRVEAAAFVVNTWIPFLAQFEPDTVHWHWTSSLAECVVPLSWCVELDMVPAIGNPLADAKQSIDAIYGRGNIVREVLCPGRKVLDSNGTVLAQSGAVICVGE